MSETTGEATKANPCKYYVECGNHAPPGESICESCLDAVRARDRQADYTHYPDYLEGAPSIHE